MSNTLSIEVSVSGDGTSAAAVRCVARNVSDRAVHVFVSKGMPYLLDEGGALVVLHGVHALPEDRELNLIQIPTTRPLAAGETLTFEAALQPLQLHGHYGDEPSPPRHGPVKVVCRIAHGATPIEAADQRHLSIDALLEWQTLESSPAVIVQLPQPP
jgi:hypothetical protein